MSSNGEAPYYVGDDIPRSVIEEWERRDMELRSIEWAEDNEMDFDTDEERQIAYEEWAVEQAERRDEDAIERGDWGRQW